jgi:hypothetical protein
MGTTIFSNYYTIFPPLRKTQQQQRLLTNTGKANLGLVANTKLKQLHFFAEAFLHASGYLNAVPRGYYGGDY